MESAAPTHEDRAARYSRGAIWFHWTIAALILVNVFIGLFHDSFGDGMRGASMNYHKAAGILILFLSIGRLAWRLAHRPPPFASHLRRWEAWLAHITHRLFYFLMIAVPLAGWLYVSTSLRVRPISFSGCSIFRFCRLREARAAPICGTRRMNCWPSPPSAWFSFTSPARSSIS